MPASWVSARARRMEPGVLGAIALCLTGIAVFLHADLPSAGAVALLPLLAAAWAQARPAWRQRELAVRALAVAASALLLPLLGAEGTASSALWQLWLGLVTVGYALLLRPGWSLALVAFVLVPLVAARIAPDPAAGLSGIVETVLLLGFPAWSAGLVGVWLRTVDARRESACIDPSTHLCTLQGLLAYGGELLACRSQPDAALAVFDCSDLLEVRRIYGSRVARTLLLRLSDRLVAIAGERGLAARTGPAEFAVLLPGAGRERALQALQQVLGAPSHIEYEAGDSEIMLVPDFLLGRIGEEEDDLPGLHKLLSRKLAWAREQEARRRRYLRRERERHSRPMALAGEAQVDSQPAIDLPHAAPVPPSARLEPAPTMPLPLALTSR